MDALRRRMILRTLKLRTDKIRKIEATRSRESWPSLVAQELPQPSLVSLAGFSSREETLLNGATSIRGRERLNQHLFHVVLGNRRGVADAICKCHLGSELFSQQS
mmetsp:Transcript_21238/g.59318  ORF Transcript_21238/g.59318 Transcript_21238/m.59318 type:complete len:105 (-) Transcript_21238:342-656(-)